MKCLAWGKLWVTWPNWRGGQLGAGRLRPSLK